MGAENGEPVDRIDAALKYWRQGDVALEETWFIHAGDPATPLSAAASEAEQSGLQGLISDVEGLVVISQTCDIVRSCGGERPRPYVEVCPLIDVDDEELRHIVRGRPRVCAGARAQARPFCVPRRVHRADQEVAQAALEDVQPRPKK